jgi:hypothetical protein
LVSTGVSSQTLKTVPLCRTALSNGLDRPFNALLKLLAELSPQMGM